MIILEVCFSLLFKAFRIRSCDYKSCRLYNTCRLFRCTFPRRIRAREIWSI